MYAMAPLGWPGSKGGALAHPKNKNNKPTAQNEDFDVAQLIQSRLPRLRLCVKNQGERIVPLHAANRRTVTGIFFLNSVWDGRFGLLVFGFLSREGREGG
ncbi:MAG: hypothetical protein ABSF10_04080 [Verrucomicrobiota bacterium]|jgi:hypothetical protein